MTKKYFKLLLSLGIILCILCGSLTITVMASKTGNDDMIETAEFSDSVEKTTEPVNIEDIIGGSIGGIIGGIGDSDEVLDEDIYRETQENTTEKPTTTRPTTTKAPVKTSKPDNTVNNTVKETEKTTKETTQKETKPQTKPDNKPATKAETSGKVVTETVDPEEALLPEGAFFVYLERNNGERRLKFDLSEPGLVPEPNEPVRPGYVFKGWFSDPEFKKAWDFSKHIAEKGTIIYAKWEPDANTIEYKIKVQNTKGGKIEVHPGSASVGEPVIITVIPEQGKRLLKGSITINGEHSDVLSFIMPREDVVVGASFEDIPEEKTDNNKTIIIPIVIALAVLLVIGLVVVIIIIKYKTRPAVIEYDENGAIILDNDDDDGWVDDSIVIEDGFANGRIVREGSEEIDMGYDTETLDEFATDHLNTFESKESTAYETELLEDFETDASNSFDEGISDPFDTEIPDIFDTESLD